MSGLLTEYPDERRSSWTFEHDAIEVRDASAKQVALSEQRLEYWDKQYKKAREYAAEKGLKVTDFQDEFSTVGASGYSMSNKMIPAPQVVIDPTIQTRIQHTWQRMRYHEARIREFQRWVVLLNRVVEPNEARTIIRVGDGDKHILLLTPNDVAYFWPEPDRSDVDLSPAE